MWTPRNEWDTRNRLGGLGVHTPVGKELEQAPLETQTMDAKAGMNVVRSGGGMSHLASLALFSMRTSHATFAAGSRSVSLVRVEVWVEEWEGESLDTHNLYIGVKSERRLKGTQHPYETREYETSGGTLRDE